jgi:hypothetical protein
MSVAIFALWQKRRLSKERVERPWRCLFTEYAPSPCVYLFMAGIPWAMIMFESLWIVFGFSELLL